jgi:hypothetical protein
MEYLLLIYGNENQEHTMTPAEKGQVLQDYGVFTKSIVQSGHMRGANRLRPTSTASTVRVRNGKTGVSDGPFAETREHLGGYYLVEAKDLDEAIEIAARIPTAKHGSIEVRPIWPMSEY